MVRPAAPETFFEEIDADVVVIGGGLMGALMAWKMQQQNLSVAVIDAGPPVNRVEAAERFKKSQEKGGNSAYEEKPWDPIPDEDDPENYYVQPGYQSKDPLEQVQFGGWFLKTLGGTSWHFTGHMERMYPTDFTMKSSYGVGHDWPISYQEMEPYWAQVEEAWGVAGDADCVAPTVHPYPLPVVPTSYLDETVGNASNSDDIPEPYRSAVGPLPHCRTSAPYDGRPQCCGNASCRFICPIGAKYDGSVHIKKAAELGARIYPNRVAFKIEVGEDGKISGVHYWNFDSTQKLEPRVNGIARAKAYVLAAHAIEGPRLLLMSADESRGALANGVANSSDQVGRNLMGLGLIESWAYVDQPVYPLRGPVNATGTFRGLRNGEFRKEHASIETIIWNGGFNPTLGPIQEAQTAIDAGYIGKGLRDRIRDRVVHQCYLDSTTEVLPNEDNRMTLSDEVDVLGLPRPKLNYRFDDYTLKGLYAAWTRQSLVLQKLGGRYADGTPVIVPPTSSPEANEEFCRKFFFGEMDDNANLVNFNERGSAGASILGTARMGDENSGFKSVVDPYCRSHDHPNLFICGTLNYVTGGVVSPSLTAGAISLRAAEHIVATFKDL